MEMTLYIYQTFLFKLTKRLKLLGLCVTKLVLPPTPNPCHGPVLQLTTSYQTRLLTSGHEYFSVQLHT